MHLKKCLLCVFDTIPKSFFFFHLNFFHFFSFNMISILSKLLHTAADKDLGVYCRDICLPILWERHIILPSIFLAIAELFHIKILRVELKAKRFLLLAPVAQNKDCVPVMFRFSQETKKKKETYPTCRFARGLRLPVATGNVQRAERSE